MVKFSLSLLPLHLSHRLTPSLNIDTDLGVHYRSLYPFSPPDHTAYLTDLEKDTTRQLLIDYFQLSTPLSPLYERWSLSDPKFRNKLDNDQEEGKLKGIRVLKQDEWETLVS